MDLALDLALDLGLTQNGVFVSKLVKEKEVLWWIFLYLRCSSAASQLDEETQEPFEAPPPRCLASAGPPGASGGLVTLRQDD